MCIIVAKPAGIEMPSKSTLQNCYDNNPDGAGFMFADGKEVTIMKGFFDFEEFYSTVSSIEDTKSTPIVMHFRIQTHGGVSAACCHPFPVSRNEKDLSSECTSNRIGVAHNGIIDVARSSTKNGISDTMAFIQNVIFPVRMMHEDFIHDQHALDVIEFCGDSKFAFLDNSMDVVLLGDFIESDGVFYSNSTYARKHYGYSTYGAVWESHFDYGSKWESNTFGNSYGEPVFPYVACSYCDQCAACDDEGAFCKSCDEARDYVSNIQYAHPCDVCESFDCDSCTVDLSAYGYYNYGYEYEGGKTCLANANA